MKSPISDLTGKHKSARMSEKYTLKFMEYIERVMKVKINNPTFCGKPVVTFSLSK